MAEEYKRQVLVMGSVPSLGPVILFDDMEDFFKWAKSGTGGDDVVEKDTTEAYNGDACLHAKTRITAAAEDDYVGARRSLYQRPAGVVGVELIWKHGADAATKIFSVGVGIQDGTYAYVVWFQYLADTHKWQYWNSGQAWTDVPGGSQDLSPGSWHRLFFSFNTLSGKYVDFVSDAFVVDVSALLYYKDLQANPALLNVDLKATAGASPPAEVYVDDILIREL